MPFTGEIKEPRYRMKALEAEERNRNYVEYELPYTREEIVAESTRCLQCTCEAIATATCGDSGSSTHDAHTWSRSPRGCGLRSVGEKRSRGSTTTTSARTATLILREPSRCIDCGRCAQVCAEVVGAACYDFMRIGFDTL